MGRPKRLGIDGLTGDKPVQGGLWYSDEMRAARSAAGDNRMPANTKALIKKIESLPAERIAEVEEFVDFLATKARRLSALDRLVAVAPALEAAGAPPITEGDIAAEVEAVRTERRRRGRGADRS